METTFPYGGENTEDVAGGNRRTRLRRQLIRIFLRMVVAWQYGCNK